MVQIHSFTTAPLVMNNFRASIYAMGLLAFAQTAQAEHEALELLFANGAARLAVQQLCEPHQLAAAPLVDSSTLAQDIAWVLADMSESLVDTDSSCEIDSQGKKLCKVVFSTRNGEFEWARVYQFELIKVSYADSRLRNLTCFTIP